MKQHYSKFFSYAADIFNSLNSPVRQKSLALSQFKQKMKSFAQSFVICIPRKDKQRLLTQIEGAPSSPNLD